MLTPDAPDFRDDFQPTRRDPLPGSGAGDRPLADREVPLPGAEPSPASEAIQQWLDGELSEAAARRVDARQVEFWTRMREETDRRQRMTTPAHVPQRIMDALPGAVADRPLRAQAAPDTDGEIALKPSVAVMAAAAFTAIGFALGRLL